MTSNLASDETLKKQLEDFPSLKAELLKFLTPEFLNRIDEVIKFNQLDEKSIQQIVKLELDKLADRISENKEILLSFTDKTIEFIAKASYDNQFGARPIRRYIQNKIESLLAYKIIDGELVSGQKYNIDVFAGNFIITNL